MCAVPTDEIYEKYLQKAILEINELGDEIARAAGGARVPVLGSGHPLADVFLLKHSPQAAEVEEGVAFYGRAGNALMKSLRRLSIDPLAVYGTLCVKCPVADPSLADPACVGRVVEELAIVQPKIVVAMGPEALRCLNELEIPLAQPGAPLPGELQELTPSIRALYVPDIDECLDEEDSKREFWAAFKVLGQWYADLPPY